MTVSRKIESFVGHLITFCISTTVIHDIEAQLSTLLNLEWWHVYFWHPFLSTSIAIWQFSKRWAAVVFCRLQNVIKNAATNSDSFCHINTVYVTNECTWHDAFKFLVLDTIFNYAKEKDFINVGHIVLSKISISFFYGTHSNSERYLFGPGWSAVGMFE